MGRVRQPRLPGIMPQSQHAAHGHIHPPLRQGVGVFAFLQQGHHRRLHLHRGNPRLVVDLLQPAGTVGIDIEEIVVLRQHPVYLLSLGIKGLLGDIVPPQGGDGIKHIQKHRLIRLLALGAAAQQRHQQQCRENPFAHPRHLLIRRFPHFTSPLPHCQPENSAPLRRVSRRQCR